MRREQSPRLELRLIADEDGTIIWPEDNQGAARLLIAAIGPTIKDLVKAVYG